ncbi:ATP-binding protein [Mucilaginibacter litoreus]|uniref:ATP-binding protein n=1 Tax=Mucilaginibacter litoreus TaxID=1048221 RepID=A0ABW3AWH3_9SPHI
MVDATHRRFIASDRSYYAIVKREAHNMALAADFSEKRIAEMDIVLAEMTSNLHKYAKDGEILVGHFKTTEAEYIELISLDNGPGMADPAKMLTDGFSSTSTIGHGLGSIKRLSDFFEIYSLKGWGTILVSRIYKIRPDKLLKRKPIDIGAVVIAKPPETVSGDGYYLKSAGKLAKLIVADGLGHGPEANHAVNEAVRAFKSCTDNSPTEIIRYLHAAVRKTRGLVATIVVFDFESKTYQIAGVGNIATKFAGIGQYKNHLSYNGIIGHNIPNTMNDQLLSFQDYGQVILCSDGIRSRWELNKYPGILRYDLTMQAAVIYKEYGRLTDDMSVIIVKL